MRLDEAALDDYTDRFSWSAWRYETLDRYDVASDDDGFQRYLDGRDPDPGFGVAWRRWLGDRRAEGRRIYRTRVLYRKPSPYLRFEFEWGYTGNAAAGEQIRILDLTERPRPPAVIQAETWLMDLARVAVMAYTDSGAFSHADTAEGDDATPYVRAAQQAWDAGEPFEQWWDRHPEYHRAAWLDGATTGG